MAIGCLITQVSVPVRWQRSVSNMTVNCRIANTMENIFKWWQTLEENAISIITFPAKVGLLNDKNLFLALSMQSVDLYTLCCFAFVVAVGFFSLINVINYNHIISAFSSPTNTGYTHLEYRQTANPPRRMSKSRSLYSERDLETTQSPRAYTERESSELSLVPRTFFRMWRHQRRG